MAQQVDVQLELLAAWGQREHLVVQLVRGRARAQQAQARAHARDVRVHRHLAQPEREQQHAGRRLAAHAGQAHEVLAALVQRHAREPVERERVRRVSGIGADRP